MCIRDRAQIAGKQEPQEPFSSAYKQVKTVSGTIWVYIPQQITNKIFNLGSKYQLEMITKGQAIEVGQSIADELTDILELDHPIEALGFLLESKTIADTNAGEAELEQHDSEESDSQSN